MLRLVTPPESFGAQIWNHLGASPGGLIGAVIAAVAIYMVFLLFVRIAGPRVLQGMHTFDAVVVLMFGGVCARVTLGNEPTLMTGIVALATLFVMEAIFGKVRDTVRGSKLLNSAPTAVVVDGVVDRRTQKRLNISDEELTSALRRAGVHHLSQVRFLVLEPNGQFSVIRTGQEVDPWILKHIRVGKQASK